MSVLTVFIRAARGVLPSGHCDTMKRTIRQISIKIMSLLTAKTFVSWQTFHFSCKKWNECFFFFFGHLHVLPVSAWALATPNSIEMHMRLTGNIVCRRECKCKWLLSLCGRGCGPVRLLGSVSAKCLDRCCTFFFLKLFFFAVFLLHWTADSSRM